MKTAILTLCFYLAIGYAFAQATAKGASIEGNAVQGIPGKTWAVVVGISKYKNIQSLNYADRDAQVFYDYLVHTDGGPKLDPSRVKLLLNENALSAEIYGALDWLSESVKENDRVIFYFSGHGDVEKKTVIQNGFLLATDAPKAAYMTSGTISIKYVQDYLETYIVQNKAKDVILIADACRSGKLAGGNEGVQLTMHALGQNWNNQIIKILSAQEGEVSYEDQKWGGGRGVFSYYLVKGIEGLADRNNDSLITTTELDIYLAKAVPDALDKGQVQNPMIDGNRQQKLFTFDKKTLALARQGEEPAGQVLASTGKGTADELGPDIQMLYNKYLDYLKDGRLVWGKDEQDTLNCARHVYWQLVNKPGAESIQASLKSSFITALLRKTDEKLDDYVNGKQKAGSYEAHRGYEAYKEISYLTKLVGPGHILYDYIMARAYFMESLDSKNENNRKSIELIKKCLQFEEDAPYALNDLGFLYNDLRMPDSAIYYYQKALLAAPQWSYPYNNLGTVYADQKAYDKAILNYQKAIQLDSTYATPYTNLGSVYDDVKVYDKARLYYQKAIQLDGTYALTYIDLGSHYQALKAYDNALIDYQKALQLDSANTDSYINLGSFYIDLMEYDKAKMNYQKVVQLDSTDADGYLGLAGVYVYLKDYSLAIMNYQKAIQLDKTGADGYVGLGGVYVYLKSYDKAIMNYQKAIQLDSTDADSYANLAHVYDYIKNYDKAIISLQKAIRLDSSAVDFYTGLGTMYIYKKDMDKAIPYFQKALSLNMDDPASYYNLTYALCLTNNCEKGLEYLKQALEKGFSDYEYLLQYKSIRNLRKMPEFNTLMKQYLPDKRK